MPAPGGGSAKAPHLLVEDPQPNRAGGPGQDTQMEFVVFGWTTWGLVYILTQSTIMHVIRNKIADQHLFLEVLVYCPACTGFWVGVALGSSGYAAGLNPIEAGIVACALGAVWGVYGPPSVWSQERDHHGSAQEKTDESSTSPP